MLSRTVHGLLSVLFLNFYRSNFNITAIAKECQQANYHHSNGSKLG